MEENNCPCHGVDDCPDPEVCWPASAHLQRKDGHTFGEAIAFLKGGRRVARAGWNGRGMWLALTPGSSVPARGAPMVEGLAANHEHTDGTIPHARLRGAARALALAEPDRGEIAIGAHIDMRAADGSLVIGWLASQTDMLAEDWVLLPRAEIRGG